MENPLILYNPLAGKGAGKAAAEALRDKLGDNATIADITKITNYRSFLSDKRDRCIVICGGDGTLNRFVNDTAHVTVDNPIYYLAVGSGNDFLRDLDVTDQTNPINITRCLHNLPTCEVNGKVYRFINGIGYGIDGYCCEMGDELRRKQKTSINYTAIAIKGLLFHYRPTDATVTVDGQAHHFKKVWLAPTMNGRYYGGGMMPTPDQLRDSTPKTVSTFVFHGSGKLKTLLIFPKIFSGTHLKHTDVTTVMTGHDITVTFDRPRALQVDGETIKNVRSYRVCVPAS